MKKILAILCAIVLSLSFTACAKNTQNGEIENLSQLKGKVVYNIKQGDVPDLTFRYLLQQAGVEYELSASAIEGKVALAYAENASLMPGLLLSKKADYVVSAEPSVSNMLDKVEGSKRLLSLQTLYANAASSKVGEGYPQAVLVAKTAALESHGQAILAIKDYLANNVAVTLNNENIAALTAAGSTVASAASQAAADKSGLCSYEASENIAAFGGYFTALKGVTLALEPNPIGGDNPPDSFYTPTYSANSGETKLKFYAPDGSPALRVANFLTSNHANKAEVKIVAPAQIGENFIKNADIAILPSIAAANLYNKGISFKVLSIVTNGNLYLLGN